MDQIVPPSVPNPSKIDVKLPKVRLHPYFKKIFLPFLGVLVLVGGVVLGVPLVRQITRLITPASENLVDLSFLPSKTTVSPGEEFDVNVLIDAKTHQVSAVSVSAVFSSSALQVKSINIGPFLDEGYDPATMTRMLDTNIQSDRGTIIIGAACPNDPPADPPSTPCLVKSGAGVLATFKMQVLAGASSGITQISFDTSDNKTAVAILNQDTTALGDASALDLNIQPTASTNVNLEMRIKFQGISTQRPDKSVSIEIKQQDNSVNSQSITFASDTSGTYSGTLPTTIAPGTYDLYIQGPTHLRKKFPSISLSSGNNALDLTSTLLTTGDVDHSNSIEISDLTGIISAWVSSETPTNSQNSLYDVDENDLISISDLTQVISNWTESVVNGD